MKPHYNVVCALMCKENKIYACKRPEGKLMAGYFEFPGGKIEPGETKEEAIVREIKEELDTIVKPIAYLGVTNHEYDTFTITLHAFKCEIIEGSLTLLEHTEGSFYTKEELKKLKFAGADVIFIDRV